MLIIWRFEWERRGGEECGGDAELQMVGSGAKRFKEGYGWILGEMAEAQRV